MSASPVITTNWNDKYIPSIYETWDRTAPIKLQLGYTPLIRNLKQTLGTNINVLDYGCGPGIISRRLAQDGIRHIEAVDISAQAIQKANNHSEQKSINYRVINSAEIPFSNNHFNATVCSFVFVTIYSRDDFANVVYDIYRTLKPGGIFYILDHNPDQTGIPYPSYQFGESGVVYRDGEAKPSYMKFPNGDVWNVIDTYWTRSTYEDILRSAGFTNLQLFECDANHLPEHERRSLLGDNITKSPFLIFKATKRSEIQSGSLHT